MLKRTLVASLSLALLHCATAPISNERVIAAEAPIRATEEIGGNRIPGAALELKLARDEMQQAKGYISTGDQPRAEMFLARAQADAELALALAKEAPTIAAAKSAQDELRQLQQTNQNATP